MSLASYFLVIFEHENRKRVPPEPLSGHDAYWYAFIGTAFWLLSCIAVLTSSGLQESATALPLGLRNVIFCRAYRVWDQSGRDSFSTSGCRGLIPRRPAMSALMSGVMIKMAIYGLWIFLFSFLGEGPDGGTGRSGVAILSTFGSPFTLSWKMI